MPLVPGLSRRGPGRSALLEAEAARIGYPVLIKAVGRRRRQGHARRRAPADFAAALDGAPSARPLASFGDDRVLIEKYLTRPRHIEIQVFADTPRQHRLAVRARLLDPAPPPEGARGGAGARAWTPARRRRMGEAAVAAARAVGYVGAGTVEFIAEATTPSISWR